jgi:hypothetical protein
MNIFVVARGDRVICYQCGGGLRDWDVDDRPWNEHAFWFPSCPLVNAVMGNEFITKVKKIKVIFLGFGHSRNIINFCSSPS